MKNKTGNPLLCDSKQELCEPFTSTTKSYQVEPESPSKPVKIIYFTDPICSSCWGIEPQLKKLELEYGHLFNIQYCMGGLLPDWNYDKGGISKPLDVAKHWDEVGIRYQMPLDGDVWRLDPLHSSFPPSIAFKAAQLQSEVKAIRFLRRIREMVFLEKKNITKWEYLNQAALDINLDLVQFKMDFEGKANQAFQDDLALAQNLRVRGFPTLYFFDQDDNRLLVYGCKPYERFKNALTALLPDAEKQMINTSIQHLFHQFHSLTTKEFATLSNQSFEEAMSQLEASHKHGELKKRSFKNGEVWER